MYPPFIAKCPWWSDCNTTGKDEPPHNAKFTISHDHGPPQSISSVTRLSRENSQALCAALAAILLLLGCYVNPVFVIFHCDHGKRLSVVRFSPITSRVGPPLVWTAIKDVTIDNP